jgi:CO/xanthine dehydrogenase Mo-binding subunit
MPELLAPSCHMCVRRARRIAAWTRPSIATSPEAQQFVAGNGNPPLGVGECAQGRTAAAIANAVYDALGIRVRSLPLTAEQLIAAIPD